MATERENIPNNTGLGVLSMRRYDVAGNNIRAYFDGADNLVFVVDETVTPDKPNALLVIYSNDGRKWDDILANDYAVSLEMVRPKKDNKYQKLDIEYVGLDEYEDLIRDYDDGVDVADALNALDAYRVDAAVRAATERLHAAEEASENARETIARAQDAIADAQGRVKALRSKLSQQKKSVGREPTKQSAAKILRTESQIDAIRDKQNRAQRRLDNARRRLVAAEEDAEIARAILARHEGGVESKNTLPAAVPPRAVAKMRADSRLPAAVKPAPVPAPQEDIIIEEQIEPKAEEMAEEVKPLFDTDPEILDEEIAFKPIDFDVNPTSSMGATAASTEPRFDDYDAPVSPAPLSFAPPADVNNEFQPIPVDVPQAAPVLDTITSVEMPVDVVPDAPAPVYDTAQNVAARPMPVSPASDAAPAVRPVSPVTGMATTPVGGGNDGRKPTFLYYILLVALIVLSIFTLWLYQKKNSDTVPDLAATTTVPQKEEPASENASSPFIVAEETVSVATVQPEPEPTPAPVVVEPEPEPEPEPVVPVVDETVPAIPVVAEPEPIEMPEETPFLSEPEPEPEPVKPTVVNKPAYNAGSQNDNMFVASADYDTDVAPVVADDAPVCDDGTAPDSYGCCGDEQYSDLGGGAFACCSPATGDCYPPMF